MIVYARIVPGLCLHTDVKLVLDETLTGSLTWKILKAATIIASSDDANGWTVVINNDQTMFLCAPEDAVIANDYKLVASHGEDIFRCYFHVVVDDESLCEDVTIPSPILSDATNCSVSVTIPDSVVGVYLYKLKYTDTLSDPLSSWTEYPTPFSGGETVEVSNLIKETTYYFVLTGYTLNGSVTSLFSMITTEDNPEVENDDIISVIGNIGIVGWPLLADCASAATLYYKVKGSGGAYLEKHFTDDCDNRIEGLLSSTNYTSYMGITYPGDIEEISENVDFTTKITPVLQATPTEIIWNRVSLKLPDFANDWKRVDIEILLSSSWVVKESYTTNISTINIGSLVEQTEYELRLVVYSNTESYIGPSIKFTTPNKTNTGEIFPPDAPGYVAVALINLTSVRTTVPTLPAGAETLKLIYTTNPNNAISSWTTSAVLSAGQTANITGLISDKDYWIAAIAITGDIISVGKAVRFTTLCEAPVNDEEGIPPEVDYEVTGYSKVKFNAPNLEDWPLNAGKLTLEAKEKEENSETPDTGLWITIKTNVHIGDTFIIDNTTLKNCMDYDFRWVAIL